MLIFQPSITAKILFYLAADKDTYSFPEGKKPEEALYDIFGKNMEGHILSPQCVWQSDMEPNKNYSVSVASEFSIETSDQHDLKKAKAVSGSQSILLGTLTLVK